MNSASDKVFMKEYVPFITNEINKALCTNEYTEEELSNWRVIIPADPVIGDFIVRKTKDFAADFMEKSQLPSYLEKLFGIISDYLSKYFHRIDSSKTRKEWTDELLSNIRIWKTKEDWLAYRKEQKEKFETLAEQKRLRILKNKELEQYNKERIALIFKDFKKNFFGLLGKTE